MADEPLEFWDAYAFKTDLSLEQLKAKLNELGPYEWIDRDSEQFGDYISALVKDDYGMAKIYATDGGYQIDLEYEAGEPEWKAFLDSVLGQLLPAVGARDVTPTDTMS